MSSQRLDQIIPELADLYDQGDVADNKQSKKPIHRSRTSSFLITISPNMGSRRLEFNENVKFVNEFKFATDHLVENIASFTKKFQDNAFKLPQTIKQPVAALEKGDKKAQVHAHITVHFDRVCLMDNQKMEQFYWAILSKYFPADDKRHIYVVSKLVQSDRTMDDYVKKSQLNASPENAEKIKKLEARLKR